MKLDTFTRSYITTMLWAECDDEDQPLDRNYSESDIEPTTLARIIADCAAFQSEGSEWYDDSSRAGHDFWLTREGHGAGFWDGDYPEPQATLLTNLSHRFGHVDCVASEGMIYLEPSPESARGHALRLDPEAFGVKS